METTMQLSNMDICYFWTQFLTLKPEQLWLLNPDLNRICENYFDIYDQEYYDVWTRLEKETSSVWDCRDNQLHHHNINVFINHGG